MLKASIIESDLRAPMRNGLNIYSLLMMFKKYLEVGATSLALYRLDFVVSLQSRLVK